MGYLISETTKEEREKIVAESLGNIGNMTAAGRYLEWGSYIEFNKKYANFHIATLPEHMRGKTNVTLSRHSTLRCASSTAIPEKR